MKEETFLLIFWKFVYELNKGEVNSFEHINIAEQHMYRFPDIIIY